MSRSSASRAAALSAALVVSLAGAALGADEAVSPSPAADAGTDAEAIDWLFVQNAASGTLETESDGTAQLVLADVHEDTIAFSDTPYRKVESLATADVVDVVTNSVDKPNAALQVESPTPVTVVLTLNDGTYDAQTGTLTYDVEFLAQGALGDLSPEGELADGTYVDPTLFIDGEQLTTDGSGNISGPFTIGSTCEDSPTDTSAKCWQAKKGGTNWPPMYDSITVTFKNVGSGTLVMSAGLLCGFAHHYQIDPGKTQALTFHHKNEICVWAGKMEIVSIQTGSGS